MWAVAVSCSLVAFYWVLCRAGKRRNTKRDEKIRGVVSTWLAVQQRAHAPRSLLLHAGRDMRVDVHRHRDPRVPQPLLHHLHGLTRFQPQRGARMPQAVEGDRSDLCGLHQPLEHAVAEAARWQRQT